MASLRLKTSTKLGSYSRLYTKEVMIDGLCVDILTKLLALVKNWGERRAGSLMVGFKNAIDSYELLGLEDPNFCGTITKRVTYVLVSS